MSRIGWLDLRNGVAGDMMLGALVSAGVPLESMSVALEPLDLPITLHPKQVDRCGLRATKIHVETPSSGQPRRTWREVRAFLNRLDDPLRDAATAVFAALADAEGKVHGVPPEEVHFHEVGALDAIADVVASCAGFLHLGLSRVMASPIALGGGVARTEHGLIPVPGPAVLALLERSGAPGFGGPDDVELATPTGVAIATVVADGHGAMPTMVVTATGVGAGDADPAHRPNVVRLVVGDAVDAGVDENHSTALVLEANVDDMDPRMWPSVVASLLEAGAGDAWLVPIAMKKGRPAHTVCAMTSPDAAPSVRAALFRETTTIGLRESPVAKHVLRREFRAVEIGASTVAVKLGITPDGVVVNATPEWEDVVGAARAAAVPVKHILAEANGRAADYLGRNVDDTASDLPAVGGRDSMSFDGSMNRSSRLAASMRGIGERRKV